MLVYGGIAGALDHYARQRGLDLEMIFFRFAPDENPEQYLIDHRIQFVIYPAGNAFAKAKYPYLEMYDSLTRGRRHFSAARLVLHNARQSTLLDLVSVVLIYSSILISPSMNAARSLATFFPTDTFAGNRPSTCSNARPGVAPLTPMKACPIRN